MNQGLSLNNNIKLTQQQTLAPQQIQALKLLEMNILDLEQTIRQEVSENPFLELTDDNIEESSIDEKYDNKEDNLENLEAPDELNEKFEEVVYEEDFEDLDNYYLLEKKSKEQEEASNFELYAREEESLVEYLEKQLPFIFTDPFELKIAEYIVGCINDEGFLEESLESIAKNLGLVYDSETKEFKFVDSSDIKIQPEVIEYLEEILHRIKLLDPPGCGARTIQEALLAQLEAKGMANSLHYEIIEKYYNDFSSAKIKDLARKLDRPISIIEEVIEDIKKLSLHPASAFSRKKDLAQVIIPDVIVEKVYDELKGDYDLIYYLNNPINLIFKNDYYKKIKKTAKLTAKEQELLKIKRDIARDLVNVLRQRNSTLELLMDYLIKVQRDYFLSGDVEKLKPLNYEEVSKEIGIHSSTISRVVNSKYVKTDYGIKPIKFFFPSSFGDGERSNLAVMEELKRIIETEDKKKPYSDEKLAELLSLKIGERIARRTVTKYREKLNILPARLRKLK